MNSDLPNEAVLIRATLYKKGEPDIDFELRRVSKVEFEIIENGEKVGSWVRGLPLQRPNAPVISFGEQVDASEAFFSCLKTRYPGYSPRKVETVNK